ncbi:MAG TPA: peptide deformylase [Syntrophomonadaceae bacterium]|nr:peptide deformylase [Syntrophomonadaceae bacterium]
MIREILLLGNPRLYQISSVIEKEELGVITTVVDDLHDTLRDFKRRYGAGRAIAAPQIGVFKRLIYMYVDTPLIFINPTLHFEGNEVIEVLDDCMSFPDLLVKVKRYKKCTIQFQNLDFKKNTMVLEGDMAELIQHEYDHLNGILATMRAVDNKSFCLKSQKGVS